MKIKEKWVSWEEFYKIQSGIFSPAAHSHIAAEVGGLTLGSIPFADAAGVLTEDNPELFWDSGADMMGIGGVPSAKLDVYGNVRVAHADDGKISWYNAAGAERAYLQIADTILKVYADSDIEIHPNNALAAKFLSDGTLQLGEISLINDQIWDNSDNEGGAIVINDVGKDGGVTQFKNLSIRDGKGNTIALFQGSNRNVGLGVTAWGTAAVQVLGIGSGTAPTTSPADMLQLWSEDRSAGYAQLHYRAEGGVARPLDSRYNVMDYGAVGNGVADDEPAIRAALDDLPVAAGGGMGGWVYFPPGHVWGIGSTITIDIQGTRFGSDYGGMQSQGSCTLLALAGFAGPLIEINIPAGEKGCRVESIMLDGDGEAAVTAGIEYADGTIASANLYDVAIANCPIGIITGDNIQSLIWRDIIAFNGIETGIEFGTDNRHIVIYNARVGGTTRAVLVGPDNAVANDRCNSIHFIGSELYCFGATPTDIILIRNAQDTKFINTWIEVAGAGSVTSMVVDGTATPAPAVWTTLRDCRLNGNNQATNAIELVNSSDAKYPGCSFISVTNEITVTDATPGRPYFDVDGNWTIYGAMLLAMFDADTQVGIGGIPGAKLDVYGDIMLGHAATGTIHFKDLAGNQVAFIKNEGSVLHIDADSDIIFDPGNAEAGRFLADGTLQLGEISILDDHIWDNSDNEGGAILINYEGKDGGTTQFKNLGIYDGKNNRIATFVGSSGFTGIGLSAGIDSLLTIAAGQVFIGDALASTNRTNTKMTTGLTLNQGAADNEILAFASSDVAHGITDYAETDTYARFQKYIAASGGLDIQGFTEDTLSIQIRGYYTNANESKDATALAPLTLEAQIKNGTTAAPAGANDNILRIRKGGANSTVFVFDADGDMFYAGAAPAGFQDHDDVKLIAELEDVCTGKIKKANRKDTEAVQLGIVNEGGFVSTKKKDMLLYGVIRQMNKKIETLEQEITLLKNN